MTTLALTVLLTMAAAQPPVAEVRMHDGAPTLFINGTQHSAMSYMTYAPEGRNFADMGAAGVHLYSFSATPTECTYELAPLCWNAPGEFDYANLDERAHMLLAADPDAYFFPRLYLGTPPWWADAHPDDIVLFDDGDGAPKRFTEIRSVARKSGPALSGIASWASEAWRRDTADAIRRLIRHVEQSDYAGRVVGYHLASGTTEEWMQWGSNESKWVDYSPVNTVRFREWLRAKYRNDGALRKAWNDPGATLSTATIPPKSARAAAECGLMRDPARAQAVIDYVAYNAWLTADTMRGFARTVKHETHGQRLVGVFYGYVLQLAGEPREQNAGHTDLHTVLECRDIDFISSPTSYAFRQLGTGFPHAMSLADSVKRHGKMWFDENDLRTWLTPGAKVGEFGKTATYEESLLAQQREFAWVLTNRLGMWWFDMGGGWYRDPRMLGEIAKMRGIAESCREVSGESVAEVAFVVDDKAAAYLQPGNPFSGEALVQQLPRLGRIGAPFDVVHLADIARLRKYKQYIFANAIAPDAGERRAIGRIAERPDTAVVWIGPAGLYRDGGLEPEAMTELTGLPLRWVEYKESMRIAPTPQATAWGCSDPAVYGRPDGLQRVALPDAGAGVTVLGTLEGTQTPALIAGGKNGLALFSATPALPAGLLRALAKKAGVHTYIDTEDIVWASRDLLAVSVNGGGATKIRLPHPCTVTDLWTGQVIAEKAIEFECSIPEKGTALFRLSR